MATSIVNDSTKAKKSYKRIHSVAVTGDKGALRKILKDPHITVEEVDRFGRTPLMLTVLADQIECAEILLKNGANVDAKDNRGRTALHWAAYKGLFHFCALLISRGAYWREKDQESVTALHLATKHQDVRCLALVMKELFVGEEDEQDVNQRTALHWSASYGNIEAVRMLIKQGSNIGIPDVDGKTPLHWAAMSGDSPEATATVQLILETEPSVIIWQDYEGRTALHLAVADGNLKTVETLVHFQTPLEKCNVSVLDNMFRTPLHWAANLGHTDIVNLLLDEKASYSSSDSNGATALHYAAQNNHIDTVKAFLSREGMTDEPDLERRTALMWAAGRGADSVIRAMMSHQADVNATDKTGSTALHAAAMAGHASTINTLLELGADVNVTDENKHSPLFRAAEMGQTDALMSLIKGGASVDVFDDEGRSPVHWAARGGHSVVCSNLLNNGISPNVQDSHGRTPLQCAAYGGFIDCMNVLLTEEADPDLQDQEGVTALHYACSTGYLAAVRLLLDHKSFINHMEMNEDCFTPLDHALLNGHHKVAQFMMEQGALSINTIRDLAASRIQANFRGYSVRKTFVERKQLLVKHEELRKNPAERKKATNNSNQSASKNITADNTPVVECTTKKTGRDREDSAEMASGSLVTGNACIEVADDHRTEQFIPHHSRLARANREKTYTIAPACRKGNTGNEEDSRDIKEGTSIRFVGQSGPGTDRGDEEKESNQEVWSNLVDQKTTGEAPGNDDLGETSDSVTDNGGNVVKAAKDNVAKEALRKVDKSGEEKVKNVGVDRGKNIDRKGENEVNDKKQVSPEERSDRAEVIFVDECTQTSVNELHSGSRRASSVSPGMAKDTGIGRDEKQRIRSSGQREEKDGQRKDEEIRGGTRRSSANSEVERDKAGKKSFEATEEEPSKNPSKDSNREIVPDEEQEDKGNPEDHKEISESQMMDDTDKRYRMIGRIADHASKDWRADQGEADRSHGMKAAETMGDGKASLQENRKKSSERKPHPERAKMREVEETYSLQSSETEVMLGGEVSRGHSGGKDHSKRRAKGHRSSLGKEKEEECEEREDERDTGRGGLLEVGLKKGRRKDQEMRDHKKEIDRDMRKVGPISSYGKSLSFRRGEILERSKTDEKIKHSRTVKENHLEGKLPGGTYEGGAKMERLGERHDSPGKTGLSRAGKGGVVLQRRSVQSRTKMRGMKYVQDVSEGESGKGMEEVKNSSKGEKGKESLRNKESVEGGVVLSKVRHASLDKRETYPKLVVDKHSAEGSKVKRDTRGEVHIQRSKMRHGEIGGGDIRAQIKGVKSSHGKEKLSEKVATKQDRQEVNELPQIKDDVKDKENSHREQEEVRLEQTESIVFPRGGGGIWSSPHKSVFDWRQPPEEKKTTKKGKQTDQGSKKAIHSQRAAKSVRHSTAVSETYLAQGLKGAMITLEQLPRREKSLGGPSQKNQRASGARRPPRNKSE